MTVQEAIGVIDCILDPDPWEDYGFTRTAIEALEMASEALKKQIPKDSNNVEHPSHYNTGKYECIDVMVEIFGVEAVKNFALLNTFKYLWRTDRKNGKEDIEKAAWYLRKYLVLEGKDEDEGEA